MSENKKASKPRPSVEPLASRHIFLDTQVYRALGHNPANRALTLLKEAIDQHRIVLHTTDITLEEIKRQIRENVLAQQRELAKVEKQLVSWRKGAPKSAPSAPVVFDAKALAAELFLEFWQFIRVACHAEIHNALEISASDVFRAYFDRKPPFDGEDSKEFPDAFMVEVLNRWCIEKDDKMHVVTEDKAMIRATQADGRLLPIKNITELLERAGTELDHGADEIAEAVMASPAFDSSFERALEPQIKQMGYVYVGELAEGEAFEGHLIEIESVNGWSVVGLNDRRLTLILDVSVKLRVEVQYEDRDSATYDREDDRWIGTESASTEIEETVEIEVLVDIDGETQTVRDAKILTPDVEISGPSPWEY